MNIIEKIDNYLNEAKGKFEIRKAGDGYIIKGPLKPNQTYDKGPRVSNPAGRLDDLFDTYAQAEKHLKKLGGELRSEEDMDIAYPGRTKSRRK